MLRCCLIGVSGFGDIHYKDVLRECEQGQMQILGVCVINQDEETEKCERLRQLGATIHDDYQEMLATYAGQCQLCLIPTGIPLHRPMTIAALESGASVFVEKPAAGIIDDVDAMIAAEQQHPGFVAVGYQDMYNQAVYEAKQVIVDGLIGTVSEVRCICLGPRTDTYYNRNNWAGRVRLGDTWVLDAPFSNAFSHFINLSLFFAGVDFASSADPSHMNVELYRAHEIESCDAASWAIDTAQGPCVRFYTSHTPSKPMPQTFRIIGDQGYCLWPYNYDRSQMVFYDNKDNEIKRIAYTFSSDRSFIHERLRRRIDDPASFVCGLDIARKPVLCSNAAFMAAPIETMDAAYIERCENDNGQMMTVVDRMYEDMNTAFERGVQVSAVNTDWGRAGHDIDVAGISSFGGLPG